MTTSDLIRANLASARKELAEIYPRLTDEMLDWAPVAGMRTIHGQFVEIMATEQGIVERLRGLPKRSFNEMEVVFWNTKSVVGLIERLVEVRQATLQFLDGPDEESLCSAAEVSDDFADWLELNPVPVEELFRYIARHESYHAGQLVSYLWARGDDPYKWG